MEHIAKTPLKFKPDLSAASVTETSFAEQMAKDAHGKYWVSPEARNFVDRQPYRRSVRLAPQSWHKLADVLADVLSCSIHIDDETAG